MIRWILIASFAAVVSGCGLDFEQEPPTATTPTTATQFVGVGSCLGNCGGRSSDCWCNDACQRYGDCCRDYEPLCLGTPGEPTRVDSVADGDTVRLAGGERVRLDCVDAPESDQPYGGEAREQLRDLLAGAAVRIDRDGRDRYGRTIGVLYADGRDVNQQLVARGAGWNYDRFCGNRYQADEDRARAARRGLWRLRRPVPPWDWRRGQR